MARRPNVQSDRDNWGAVLNDYLDVSLAEDGTLRLGAMADLPPLRPVGAEPASRPESVITTFAPGHGWTKHSGTGTFTDNTVDGILSGQSGALTTDGAGGVVRCRGAAPAPVNLRDNVLKIYLRVTNLAALNIITVNAWDALPGTVERSVTYLPTASTSTLVEGEWSTITMDFGWTSPSGDLDLTDVNAFWFVAQDKGGGQTATVQIGGLTTVPRSHPAFPNGVVSFTFDDGYQAVYTKMRPAMAPYDYRGTAYIIQDLLDKPNHMTTAQVQRLAKINRWEIGHHAGTEAIHAADYPALTDAEVHADFQAAKQWAHDLRLGPLDTHAWPHGQSTKANRDIAAQYFLAARGTTVATYGQPYPGAGYDLRYLLRQAPVDGSVDISDYPTRYLDPVKANGAWLILMCHNAHDTTPNSTTVLTSDFAALVDAIADRDIPVLPVREVLAKLAVPE